MTQAFNLAQLANNLNTSGQLDATDGLVGAVPVANGGTGATTASAGLANLDGVSRAGDTMYGALYLPALVTAQGNGAGVYFAYSGSTADANYHIFRPTGINDLYYDSLNTNQHVFRGASGANAIIDVTGGHIQSAKNVAHVSAYFSDSSGLIRGFNVSSYTKNASGLYTINFTRSTTNSDWVMTAACNWQSGSGNNANSTQVYARSTSSAQIWTGTPHISGITGQSQLASAGTMIAIFQQ